MRWMMKRRERKRYVLLAAALCIFAMPVSAMTEAAEETEVTLQAGESRETELGIPDGTYIPDGFSWTGGSGRVEITCENVTILDGEVFADLTFSSTSYEYVKVDGIKYYGDKDERATTFSIPAVLNQNMEITGLTTKMSSPHEITYTIYIELKSGNDPDENKNDEGTENPSAPKIIGLTAESDEAVLSAEFFSLYSYEGEVYVLEVKENESAADYLLVSEKTEIPAGLEKEMTIIRLPADHIFVCSEPALLYAAEYDDAAAKIAAVDTEVSAKIADETLLPDALISAGTWKDPDFRSLVGAGCDLVILPAESLNEDTKEIRNYFASLNIPTITERSEDEMSEEGRKVWDEVFGILFGITEESGES